MELFSYLSIGSFVIIDLIAATTNALNGAILAQRPDYYKKNNWTIVGIIALAIFGGIGGGDSRDLLLGKIPGALENPWYLILCIAAGIVGIFLAFNKAQKFRETTYQFLTAFSLPWYAAIGVAAGLSAGLPPIACVLLGVVGPTAGRFLIDITSGNTAKQFIQGEWFVGTAILTSVVYLLLANYIGLSIWPATLLSVATGFGFRISALWFGWEEPMPFVPNNLRSERKRETLKEKMDPSWKPKFD